jgi:hypothetical protein
LRGFSTFWRDFSTEAVVIWKWLIDLGATEPNSVSN